MTTQPATALFEPDRSPFDKPICPVMRIENLSAPDAEGDVHFTLGGVAHYTPDSTQKLANEQLVIVLTGPIAIAERFGALVKGLQYSTVRFIPLTRLQDADGSVFWKLTLQPGKADAPATLLRVGDDAAGVIEAVFAEPQD